MGTLYFSSLLFFPPPGTVRLEIARILAISTWDPFLVNLNVSRLIVVTQERFTTLQKAL